MKLIFFTCFVLLGTSLAKNIEEQGEYELIKRLLSLIEEENEQDARYVDITGDVDNKDGDIEVTRDTDNTDADLSTGGENGNNEGTEVDTETDDDANADDKTNGDDTTKNGGDTGDNVADTGEMTGEAFEKVVDARVDQLEKEIVELDGFIEEMSTKEKIKKWLAENKDKIEEKLTALKDKVGNAVDKLKKWIEELYEDSILQKLPKEDDLEAALEMNMDLESASQEVLQVVDLIQNAVLFEIGPISEADVISFREALLKKAREEYRQGPGAWAKFKEMFGITEKPEETPELSDGLKVEEVEEIEAKKKKVPTATLR